jgi:hypothetical protein
MTVEALKQENIVTGKTVYYIRISETGHEPLVMLSAESSYNKVKAMETGPKVEPTNQLTLEITEGLEGASPLKSENNATEMDKQNNKSRH